MDSYQHSQVIIRLDKIIELLNESIEMQVEDEAKENHETSEEEEETPAPKKTATSQVKNTPGKPKLRPHASVEQETEELDFEDADEPEEEK